MRLFGGERILAFIQRHPDSRASLLAWRRNMEANRFNNFVEVKRVFGSADYVRPYTVFNISGNKYRLMSLIDYEMEAVSVENALTHAEYDKGRWRRQP